MSSTSKKLNDLLSLSAASTILNKSDQLPYVGLEHLESDCSYPISLAKSSDSISVNFVFQSGDILFGKLRPNLRKSVRVDFGGYCSTDLLVLRAKEGIDPSFAGWVMRSSRVFSEAARTSEGTKMPRTSWSRIKNLSVYAPSLREQQLIGDILDKVDDRIDATSRVAGKYRALLEALGRSLIPVNADVASMDDGWEILPLFEVVPSADYGISSPLISDNSGVATLRMGNLSGGDIDVDDIKYTMEPVSGHLRLKERDVLFNRTNSIEHVGRTSIWRGELDVATFASYLVRLNVNLERILPEYLVYWLNQPAIVQRIRRLATPGVQQVNINPTNLRKTLIEFPSSLSRQYQIVDALDQCKVMIKQISQELDSLRLLRRGLAEDLLTGRVRVPEAEAVVESL